MAETGVFGGISTSEIAEAGSDIEAADEAGASLATRFSRRVSDLVIARAILGETGQYSVFLQSEALFEDAAKSPNHEAPLLSNGADSVSDRIWLSTSSLAAAFELKLEWADAATLFKAIREIGLGRLAALVIDWRMGAPIGTLYRKGLDSPDQGEPVIFEEVPIDAHQMKLVLDQFYERTLRTPALIAEGHAKRVWSEARKGIPEYRPEEAIQGRLLDNLRGVFVRHHLRPEPVTEDGRADIIIWKKALTQAHLPATVTEWVLELKTLCDKTSEGGDVPPSKVREAVESGVEQAIGYKASLNAVNAALCCYDMRAKDEGDEACFAPVRKSAANDNIPLWRWYLFRGTAASRAAKGYLQPGES